MPIEQFNFGGFMKILLAFLLFSGCITLSGTVQKNIDIGDSSDSVENILGEPDSVKEVMNSKIMVYQDQRDICSITTMKNLVTDIDCEDNPNYVNPVALILQGAGQGLMHAQDNTYNCTNLGGGRYSCYNKGTYYNCTTIGNNVQCQSH